MWLNSAFRLDVSSGLIIEFLCNAWTSEFFVLAFKTLRRHQKAIHEIVIVKFMNYVNFGAYWRKIFIVMLWYFFNCCFLVDKITSENFCVFTSMNHFFCVIFCVFKIMFWGFTLSCKHCDKNFSIRVWKKLNNFMTHVRIFKHLNKKITIFCKNCIFLLDSLKNC